MTKQKYILYFFTFFLTTLLVDAQNFCGTGTGDPGDPGDPGCNDNAFINSHNEDPNEIDPTTIEYDNIISGGYATIVREANGGFIIWGRHAAPNGTSNLYTPTPITSEYGYHYTGKPLKAAVGGYEGNQQFALLTTTGLYLWGQTGALITGSVTTSKNFGPVAIGTKGVDEINPKGLPYQVEPEEVKMMFGAWGTLAIVTCSGEAWIITHRGYKKADGKNDNNDAHLWHRVKTGPDTPLENVVAMRGTSSAMMALTSDGEMYTWGTDTFLGDGPTGVVGTRLWATKMVKPEGKTPKMIGMTNPNTTTQHTYYMLATDGNLYSLGGDYHKQLGNWGGWGGISLDWVQPKKPNSEGEDSGEVFDDVVWISPSEHDGASSSARGAINVLTKDKKLYAWGDNHYFMYGGPTMHEHYDPVYMPGTSPDGLQVTDNVIAVETGGNFTIIIREGSPEFGPEFGFVGHKWSGNMGDGTTSGNDTIITKYKFIDTLDVCGTQSSPTMACYKPGKFDSDLTGLSTNIGITSLRNSNTDGWPQVRKGAWIALESKTKGFVPNRLSNDDIASIMSPVEGMMVYNTTEDCLQINVDGTVAGWKCFNVQSCD